jgi:transposase
MLCCKLTDSKKGIIISWFSSGARISDIACETGHPRSTVNSIIKHFLVRHHTDNAQHPGGPRKLPPHDERTLLCKAKLSAVHHQQTWAQVQAHFPRPVPMSTLSHSLTRNGIRKWCAALKPLLTPELAQQQKDWALAYEDWTEDDWRSVVWSDECSVAKSADLRRTWVFCSPGEKYHHDCIDAWPPSKDISLMIWGCFVGNMKGPMVPLIMPSVNSRLYLATLKNLLPLIMDHLHLTYENPTFMHDNAPIHTAHIVQDWLADQDFTVMEWPPYLLDLNPIEHIWRELKAILHEQNPDLKTLTGGKDAVKACLVDAISDAWQDISEDFLKSLVDSMPWRVRAVLDADGWYTKY